MNPNDDGAGDSLGDNPYRAGLGASCFPQIGLLAHLWYLGTAFWPYEPMLRTS